MEQHGFTSELGLSRVDATLDLLFAQNPQLELIPAEELADKFRIVSEEEFAAQSKGNAELAVYTTADLDGSQPFIGPELPPAMAAARCYRFAPGRQ